MYYSIAAQEDNLGDIVIRRVLLRWILESGSRVVVFTGRMTPSYIATFDDGPHVRFVSDAFKFELLLLASVVRRKASLLFAPGPQTLKSSWRATLKTTANLVNIMLVRLTGGKVIGVGRSFRGAQSAFAGLDRLVVRQFNLFTVRDDVSSTYLGMPLRVAPDLAFEDVTAKKEVTRALVAISLRGDRHIDPGGLAEAIRSMQDEGYEVVLVSQVRRDDRGHLRLGEELGVRVIDWGSRSHAEQFRRVIAVYREAELVVSNRLHALLLGLDSGATPLILEDGTDKMTSTLRPWISADTVPASFDGVDWSAVLIRSRTQPSNSDLQPALESIASLRAEVVDHLRAQ